jgi:hypothetical protein
MNPFATYPMEFGYALESIGTKELRGDAQEKFRLMPFLGVPSIIKPSLHLGVNFCTVVGRFDPTHVDLIT